MFKRQEPIDPKKRYKFESYIGWNTSWWHYYGQYKNVIDEIVGGIENNTPIDTVSLPLLFLIRHSIELGLKSNIIKLEGVNTKVGKIKLSGTKYHSLENLFSKFVEHLNVIIKEKKISQSIKNEIDNYLTQFEPLKDILHSLDVGSFNFRYPVDTDGKLNFDRNDKVNVADIVNMYYKIQPFLVFTETVLYEEGVFGFEN
jgi:hypothetical protein